MAPSTVAGTVTAVASAFSSVLLLVSSVIGLYLSRKTRQKIEVVQATVNHKSDEQTARIDQLTHVVTNLGGNVPVDPAIDAAQKRLIKHNEGETQ